MLIVDLLIPSQCWSPDDPVVAPLADPPADPAATPPVDPAATPPAADPAAAVEPGDGLWKYKQINRQHRRIKDLETENQRLRDLADSASRSHAPAAPPGAPVPAAPAPTAPPVAVAPVASKEQVRYELQVEDLTTKIREEYSKDWAQVSRNLEAQGGVTEELLRGILATDDPAYVLIELGKNPAAYQEVLDLPPAKRQTALVKIALAKKPSVDPAAVDPAKPRPPSGAPAPVSQLSGGSPGPAVDLYDPKMVSQEKDDAWYAERRRQKSASVGRPWSTRRA